MGEQDEPGLGTHPLVMLPDLLHQKVPFHPGVDGGMAACLPTLQPLTLSSSLSTSRPQTVPNTPSHPIQPHHGLHYTPLYMKLPHIDTPLSVGEPSWLCTIHPIPATQLSEHNEWPCIPRTPIQHHHGLQYTPLGVPSRHDINPTPLDTLQPVGGLS